MFIKKEIMSETIKWEELSEVERIKYDSNYLSGTLVESLANPITGAISPNDTQISKFHGFYQQSDRDIEKERKQQKLEPALFIFNSGANAGRNGYTGAMVENGAISDKYANETLKLTTRQTFQLHGVLKKNMKNTIQEMNDSLLDTIAACGDVNRNVMSHANPAESPFYAEVIEMAKNMGGIFCQKQRHITKSGLIKN